MTRDFAAIAADLETLENLQRARDFRRMRRTATLLLLLAALLFVVASALERRWPWLAYVRAFTEASMVGGCADWFAVVAMFRYPMGIRIPHTAIIPRSKERIARTVGEFISDNFLAPDVLAKRLATVDMAGWMAEWLAVPGNVALLARQSSAVLTPIADLLGHRAVHEALQAAARRGIEAVPVTPLAAQGLTLLLQHGTLVTIAEWLIDQADQALTRHGDSIRAKIGKNSARWVPKWIDDKLADRILNGFHTSLAEMQSPTHGWRNNFSDWAGTVATRLTDDPAMVAAGERLKTELLTHPVLTEQLERLWQQVEQRLKAGDSDDGPVRAGAERALAALEQLLHDNGPLRDTLNDWARQIIRNILSPNRDRIGGYIAAVVNEWDDAVLVGKVELQMGKDLQYVRINGTLVGGLVGLVIFVVSRLAAQLGAGP